MDTSRTLDEVVSAEEPPDGAARLQGVILGGRFEIGTRIGEGGMGAVFRAYDRDLDHAVAIKFLSAAAAENTRDIERFRREAQLSRLVTHPNVLRVFEFGDSAHGPYIVMELIEGESLAQRLAREGRIAPIEVTCWLRSILDGLHAAHMAGIVHRDIKPSNVLLATTGRVVLADFGIARRSGRPGLTRTGALIGTPDYMAPEQLRGDGVDARTDLYACGALAHALVTGSPPAISGPDRQELSRLPEGLAMLIEACLRPEMGNRPASAVEAMAMLDAPPAARAARRLRALVGMVLLVLATAGAGWAARRTAPTGVMVDPVAHTEGIPEWAGLAAQDVMASALAGYAPPSRGREQRLRPVLSTGPEGFKLTAQGLDGHGATIHDACEDLLRKLQPSSPIEPAALDLATARAAWTAGDREGALQALERMGEAAGFQAILLRVLVLPQDSDKAREAALKLASLQAETPSQKAIVAAVSALCANGPIPVAFDAWERARGPKARGDAELAVVVHRLLWKAGRTDEALAVLEDQTRARPLDPIAWLLLGRAHLRMRNLAAAARILDRYISLHPGSAPGHALRGEVFFHAGDGPKAEELLSRADQMGPASAAMRLALLLALQRKDFPAAREAARRGMAGAPPARDMAFDYLALVDAEEKGDGEALQRLRTKLEELDD